MNSLTNQELKDAIEKKRTEFFAQASAEAQAVGSAPPIDANLFTCAACEATLHASLAAAIAVAIVTSPLTTAAAASIASIAAATGLAIETVRGIIIAAGAAGSRSVISSLCKAMGACD